MIFLVLTLLLVNRSNFRFSLASIKFWKFFILFLEVLAVGFCIGATLSSFKNLTENHTSYVESIGEQDLSPAGQEFLLDLACFALVLMITGMIFTAVYLLDLKILD